MELVSCQPPDDFLLPGVLSFNALMGLSCYVLLVLQKLKLIMFQCPHVLELLHRVGNANSAEYMFQCPHGLELLRQECPIF